MFGNRHKRHRFIASEVALREDSLQLTKSGIWNTTAAYPQSCWAGSSSSSLLIILDQFAGFSQVPRATVEYRLHLGMAIAIRHHFDVIMLNALAATRRAGKSPSPSERRR